MAEFNCRIGKRYYMSYPIFLKEKHDLPITYRIILSPASGIELHHSVVKLHYREVNDQAEVTDWMKDTLFVSCDKSEITKAFEVCETNLGDKRVMIEKLLNTNNNVWIEINSNIPDKDVLVINKEGKRLYGNLYYDEYFECYCAHDGYRLIKHCTHYIEID